MDGNAEINYSNLSMPDGATGSNNIDENPLFADAENFDFRLSENSPCIDAGTDIGYPYNGEAPDMGSFEYETITGIEGFQSAGFSVFPNPTSGRLYFETADINISKIQITDLNGRVLFESLSKSPVKNIDLSAFENGVYLIFVDNRKREIYNKGY